jgi:hypothetical protein
MISDSNVKEPRLALRFALVTMLRSGELLPIDRDGLNEENGTVDIPARRVKKRRVINQPLSDLALEISRRRSQARSSSTCSQVRFVATCRSIERRCPLHSVARPTAIAG